MTLIASTLNFKKPLIMSDLLWSFTKANGPIILPTNTFDLTPYLQAETEAKSFRLFQKMYVINEKTCIVFAGMNEQIHVFLSVFKNWFKGKEVISISDIHKFLEGYDLRSKFLDSAFFIIHVDHLDEKTIEVGQFFCPSETYEIDPVLFEIKDGAWNIIKHPVFDEVSACGTGTESFLNLINQPILFATRFDDADFMKAIQTNVILIAQILTKERQSNYTIKDCWGGGFEIAFYNGERFEKLDDIAYIVSHSQFYDAGDIGIPVPKLIMYYKYINGILYILSVEVYEYQISESDTHIIFTSMHGKYKPTIFEVEGLDVDDIRKYPFPDDFSFSTEKTAMGYSLVTKTDFHFNPAFFNLGPEVKVTYKRGGQIEVFVDKSINEDIKLACKRKYPSLIF